MPKRISAGSGVPKVGAPDCIDMEPAKVPRIIGTPGLRSCVKASPAIASASAWVITPAGVTGAMAPERMKGETMQAWLWRA